jgi:hypothetical protein
MYCIVLYYIILYLQLIIVASTSATQIQRVYRGHHGRVRARMNYYLQRIDATVQRWQLEMSSVAKIQRCNSGFMVRKIIIRERRRKSATLMQACFRRRLAYKAVTLIKVRREFMYKIARNIGKLLVKRRQVRHARETRRFQQYIGMS